MARSEQPVVADLVESLSPQYSVPLRGVLTGRWPLIPNNLTEVAFRWFAGFKRGKDSALHVVSLVA
jgi:hypothetical protein